MFIESFSSVFLKLAGMQDGFNLKYLFYFGCAVAVMAIYAVIWQLILEYMPLTTAYMRKGVSYIMVFVWAVVIFKETLTVFNIIGMIIIFIGMAVSFSDEK
ncbi:MAG: EamA family transporter [Clostridiales bacterium]|nr:EamA family transporter [Clostridiales bacterium]